VQPESEAERRRKKELESSPRVNDYAHAFFEHALWSSAGTRLGPILAKRRAS